MIESKRLNKGPRALKIAGVLVFFFPFVEVTSGKGSILIDIVSI